MNKKILAISATEEVAIALQGAYNAGLCPFVAEDDFDAATSLRWWRDEEGRLYATASNLVEMATPAGVEFERGAGWHATV